MEKQNTLRDIRNYCEGVCAIDNRHELLAAVPMLVEAIRRIKSMSETLKKVARAAGELNEKCSKYVLQHPTCLDEGRLQTLQNGVLVGDLTVDGETYHFVSGYGTPIRIDGDHLTQEFLSGLPDGWTKSRMSLDTTGIKRICGDDYFGQLQQYGLTPPVVNTWERKVDEAIDCPIEE